MSTHRASQSPQREAASIELDFTYFRTLPGHYVSAGCHGPQRYGIREAAWKKLNKYHIKTDSFTAPRIGTILDPRLKLETLERQGWKPSEVHRARSVLERMLKEYYPAENSQDLASSQLDDTHRQAPDEPGVRDPEDLLIFRSQRPCHQLPERAAATVPG
ncbi:hypothetical protein FN846DRAFT_1007168 [Sphaerosporella brunnea]|uniref:Uncharacterized protein n=1 Tax=Sphaerosporella brunnea TaxID=1250544 RepID=A0A5J5F2J9_9PEZI|nr:hypothetical protein FN846DRAFT_1007168 [Sphaerosporella brunnea]